MRQQFRVAGIAFDHMHMGDNLRMAHAHPDCTVVGICDMDPRRMRDAQRELGLSDEQLFSDWQHCIEACQPDFLIVCPTTAEHALWVERLAPFGLPLLVEKPMAASLADADRMIEVCQQHDVVWAINWPLVWVASHRTTKRLIDEGRIGEPIEVHYYDGNRGPLWHTAGKREIDADEVARQKPTSWFYKREAGGGSLLDYLGYGATLGTWFMQGAVPIEVTTAVDQPPGLEVDEHSITVARYTTGLSKFETRWGTFTDPWTHQPQPKCGFVVVGTEGTISSYDYEPTVRVQDKANPAGVDIAVDELEPPYQNPIQYLVHCLQTASPIEGPLSPAMSRIGQQIVDTAVQSAQQKRTLPLVQ
ncbi:MAG: gfo/Idh/MocA family oxidoreductase [Planctomycetota bacterium]|nr:MAG: gfo/Idh/MocA family oxidoreductase [Planctomycetota bacterium]